MARLMIRPRAYEDLEEISAYIAMDSPAASIGFLDAAEKAFSVLAEMPLLGVAWAVSDAKLGGMRTYLLPQYRNYLIIYRATPEGTEILRVVHGARDIGPLVDQEEQ